LFDETGSHAPLGAVVAHATTKEDKKLKGIIERWLSSIFGKN